MERNNPIIARKAKISMRPTIKIQQQNIFITAGKAANVIDSQIPGNVPTFDRHAADIATDVEKGCPLNERITEKINKVTRHRKKKLSIRPTTFIGTAEPLTLTLVIIRG